MLIVVILSVNAPYRGDATSLSILLFKAAYAYSGWFLNKHQGPVL